MDANGTRHHLLLGSADWSVRTRTLPPGSSRYDDDRQELTLHPLEFRFPLRSGDHPPELSDRRGAACDAFGNVYWIDAGSRAIRVQSAGSGLPSLFWEPGLHAAPAPDRDRSVFAPPAAAGEQPPPARPVPLCGLAVTEDHYLVAGTLDPAGILVFDLHAAGPPRQELWPADAGFVPYDICARGGGGVFVLVRGEHPRLWELDRHLAVVTCRLDPDAPDPTDFAAADRTGPAAGYGPAAPAARAHRRIEPDDGIAIGGDPIAIERAPGGRVLVLDRNEHAGPSAVRLLASPADAGPSAPLRESLAPGAPERARRAVIGHDMALVGGAGGDDLGTLYVVDRDGNQAYAFSLTVAGGGLQATLAYDYFPMRVFGGKALVAGPSGPMYDFGFGDGWIPLVRQCRPRYVTTTTLVAPQFDARVPGTVWHRLLLDATIGPGTAVTVESRTADDLRELPAASWQPEPPLVYRRSGGSELPYLPPPAASEQGTWEILFQRARGRHLQLRVTLAGDGRSTPRLHALRAYFPRFSYREHYLPKVYGEDAGSASFLDRFLANLEGFNTAIEDRIASAQALFDPRTAPADTLDWLLGWFDVAADPTWTEERRRLFLRHAMEVFALRGTVAGIQLALRLALDPCDGEQLFEPETRATRTSRIVERYRARRTPAVVLGDPTQLEGPRVVAATARWDPSQGTDALRERWRAATGDPGAEPALDDPSKRWRGFVGDLLGIDVPGPPQPELWTDFLTMRYGTIEQLNVAYGLVGEQRYGAFAGVAFPKLLPADGAALRDWYHFVSVAQPARRAAHRFTVLLAMPTADGEDTAPGARRAIAQRVVELQKPAHTVFDVKFFWAAFRLGDARLGQDTIVDRGSRDPRLRQPVVLGREHAGESYLGGEHAPTAGHAGRDPLNR
jgi:phage tail-like protein